MSIANYTRANKQRLRCTFGTFFWGREAWFDEGRAGLSWEDLLDASDGGMQSAECRLPTAEGGCVFFHLAGPSVIILSHTLVGFRLSFLTPGTFDIAMGPIRSRAPPERERERWPPPPQLGRPISGLRWVSL